ncbi:MAG: TolC family protein [Polaromonas sp.]|uniref:TolC family protein n=1 Tax=Polaromonas sp. TaxID=1869339 RepID=UPI0027363651|nr:TolC family protein [Polaromonas sp.]MDP2816896.1 TolC family protein [Polaromonas sp.]
MRRARWSAVAVSAAWLLAMALPAGATDLIDAWRAAQQHDLDYTAARAAQQASAAKRSQAAALWRPSVMLTGTAGVGGSDTSATGAQFSAPGLGTSTDVAFDTSVNRGALGRWALAASLPLLSRERDAQGRQLELSADVSDLEWQNAQQTLMLNTAQRYFDVVLASDSLRVLRQQQAAVEQALVETQDRFRLGDAPVTDTHEAAARSGAIAAQRLALETDLHLKQADIADATGMPPAAVQLLLPSREATPAEAQALEFWLSEAELRNPQLRMQITAVEVARQEAAKSSGVLSPSVELVAQVGRDRLSGSGDFGSASNRAGNRMIGVQLSVPLYTGGMRSARQQEALYGIEKAQAQADRTRQQVTQKTRAAWLGLTVGGGRVAALSQALVSSRSRLDATRLGRQVGDRTTLDLLNAENDAASAELTLLQARIELLMNRLRLAAVAGRLDEAWLQSVNASLHAPGGR